MNSKTNCNISWTKSLQKCKGKTDLLNFYHGKRLTQRQAIAANCCRCSSGYDSGFGCNVSDCPLNPYNPYTIAKRKTISAKLDDVSAQTNMEDRS